MASWSTMADYKNFLIFLLSCITIHHAFPEQKATPLKIGNFALPSSQQPGALFGLGQNIVDKGTCQAVGLLTQNKGGHKNFIELVPGILYGITNRLSLLILTPISIYHKPNEGVKSGIQNIITQFEYAIYKKERQRSVDDATLVCNIIFPTRSLDQANPTIASGPPSFLLGATLIHTRTDWYYFASPGVHLAISNNGVKVGNQYFVQCGFGKNIPTSPRFIAIWMIEFNGIFSDQDKTQGSYKPDSGGQVLYLGPTLWLSSKSIFIQGGIGLPIYQHLNGNQPKNTYLAALNVGLTL